MRTSVPASSAARRVFRTNRDTDAMEGSASPRKPIVAIFERSSAERSFDVAWRSGASIASSRPIPQPSSETETRRRPPATTDTSMRPAPASSAFSTSSLTTDAGRSTTSPAAILFATSSGRILMRGIRRGGTSG